MTPRLLACLLACASAATGAEPAWPETFQGRPARIIPLDPGRLEAPQWQTARFRFLSDEPVNAAALRRFAAVIESVPQLLQALPLPLWSPAEAREKPAIVLCRNEWAYLEAGGGEGSMGYYNARKNEIVIRADVFLTPPLAKPSRLIPKPNEDLLVHELVHLGMHNILVRSNPWFYEGVAEYIAAAHDTGGRYRFHDIDRGIRDHIRNYLPPGPDGTITLPAPGRLMASTGAQWMQAVQAAGDHDAFRPYAAALLLVHYQLSGQDRRADTATYLEALAAHRDFRQPLPALKTDEPAAIANRLREYWKPRGLNLRFVE